MLWSLLGLVAGSVAAWPKALLRLYVAVCSVLVVHGLWRMGYQPGQVSWLPLVTAMAVYAVPFLVVWKRAESRDRVPNPTRPSR